MHMFKKVGLSMSTLFKVERSMTCRALIEERMFTASIELTGNFVTCTLDDSEYCFTAQQCGELADSLATQVQTTHGFAGNQENIGRPLKLGFCKIFYQMILSRSPATQRDQLYGYDSDDMQLGAAGSFRYPGTRDSYQLLVGLNDELYLPFLGIEDRVFTFSIDEALWLIEQLCVGGYVLAQIEQPKRRTGRRTVRGSVDS